MCLLIMGMFHMLPASTFRLFEHLLAICIKSEKAVGTEVRSLHDGLSGDLNSHFIDSLAVHFVSLCSS